MLAIGTHIRTSGYEGIVVSNAEKSYYGYCPESMAIVRLERGMTVISIKDCEVINDE